MLLVTRVENIELCCFYHGQTTTPFGMDRISNPVVNYLASSFSLSGECSYLPDTGSHARNNKRILSIDPTRRTKSARWSRERGYEARRGMRSRRGRNEGKEENEKEEGLVEGYDVLGLVRLFDVGREKSALYLTPNQLRSAVPDKSFSLLPLSFAIERRALNARVCVCVHVHTLPVSRRLTGIYTIALAGAACKY